MATWIIETIYWAGYTGIMMLVFVENVFPPIPSEVIMPLAGYMAAEGRLSLLGIVVAGTAGSVLGALPLYYLGRAIGEERLKKLADRYGRWLTVSSKDIDRALNWFHRHGTVAVLICRLIPGIRSLISLPAGIKKMNVGVFLVYSAIGTGLWTALLAYAGYLVGENFEEVGDYLDLVSYVVIVGILVMYVIRFYKCKGSARRPSTNR
jgi:membrane protein DedA with SNARE-associated domain